jgi:transposase
MSKAKRVFTAEFRTQVAQRILQGEGVAKLHHEFAIKKSVLYRWRDRFRKEGAAGLDRKPGRPPGIPDPTAAPKPGVSTEEMLRRQMTELERKIGQQAVQLDFFKRAFKRVRESSQRSGNAGATASTRRSGQ